MNKSQTKPLAIAITGIGGIFPGCANLDDFWNMIKDGKTAISEAPASRWSQNPHLYIDKTPGKPDKIFSANCGYIDAEMIPDIFPGIEIENLDRLDPLCKIALKAAIDAVKDSNLSNIDKNKIQVLLANIVLPTDTTSLLSRQTNMAKIKATIQNAQLSVDHLSDVDPRNRLSAEIPASIIASSLGFGGGAYTIDAACASSLYSLKLASEELISGRADAVLAGGVSRPSSQFTQMGFTQLRALSSSGFCRPFDRQADGLIVGEGAGVFVLKRLDDAIRDKDQIYAVIRGIGLSNDVGGSLLAPDSEGQLRAMRLAYAQAQWNPEDIELIECHGTGTPVGDAVEFSSLVELLTTNYPPQTSIVIGSVKSNVGHLLTAAGAAGLMKLLFALKHKTLPPQANFGEPHPSLKIDKTPFKIIKSHEPWKPRKASRKCALSAFGFGGIDAHVLLEEWTNPKTYKSPSIPKPNDPYTPDIAIVAIEAQIGTAKNTSELQKALFNATPLKNDYPIERAQNVKIEPWFKNGAYIKEIKIEPGRFKISPKEISQILPQQLLMLQTVDNAIASMNDTKNKKLDWGVFIGINLDLESTKFACRWTIEEDFKTNSISLQNIEAVKDSISPALTHESTVGSLGGIVASRIAREYSIGGPSHTFSNAENSGISALEAATRALQRNEINTAIVGAVDLNGDLRSLIAYNKLKKFSKSQNCTPFDVIADGAFPGEGSVCLILKRKEDAIKDNNPILAIVKGIAKTTFPSINDKKAAVDAYIRAYKNAWTEADKPIDKAGLIETNGSGSQIEDAIEAEALTKLFANVPKHSSFNTDHLPCALSSSKIVAGHTGAAAGLLGVAKAALCLYQQVLPAMPSLKNPILELNNSSDLFFTPNQPQFWFRNRASGTRLAGISSISTANSFAHVVLEGFEQEYRLPDTTIKAIAESRRFPTGAPSESVFIFKGNHSKELLAQINWIETNLNDSIHSLAFNFNKQFPSSTAHTVFASIVAESATQLQTRLKFLSYHLTNYPDIQITSSPETNDRIFYYPTPLGKNGKVVFAFSGSGNHFLGMGIELGLFFPEHLRNLDKRYELLATQFAPDRVAPWRLSWPENWEEKSYKHLLENHNSLVFSHVSCCSLISDIIRSFNIEPQIIMGYSLGETSGNFATKTWRDRDEMVKRMCKSNLFTTELIGTYNAPRKHWGLSPNDKIEWYIALVHSPAKNVEKLLKDYSQVYLLIENTPEESVVGGNRAQVEKLLQQLNRPFFPLDGISSVHCEAATPAAKEYRDLHLYDCYPPDNMTFISSGLSEMFIPQRDKSADSIKAQCIGKINFTKSVELAYREGGRIFVEAGPKYSLSRMINSILGNREHLARATINSGQSQVSSLLRLVANVAAHGVNITLAPLFAHQSLPPVLHKVPPIAVSTASPIKFANLKHALLAPSISQPEKISNIKPSSLKPSAPALKHTSDLSFLERFSQTSTAISKAHEAFLRLNNSYIALQNAIISENPQTLNAIVQPKQIQQTSLKPHHVSQPTQIAQPEPTLRMPRPYQGELFLDFNGSMEFAIGKISNVLGDFFAEIDKHPTRVRLPDIPLNFVDRIILVEGKKGSLGKGRTVTQHDVYPDAWYLDNNCMPTGLSVEAGQADLFLSAWLGIDFKTKGIAKYRLLDAIVTYHGPLPRPGDTVNYDIRVDRFIRQADTYLFFFEFDGTVDSKPLITMRNGCAGFFTDQQLEDGRGIVLTEEDLVLEPKQPLFERNTLPSMTTESFDDLALDKIRTGDLSSFGPEFENLGFEPQTIPSGQLAMIDRINSIDPTGGRFNLGQIKAEIDIPQEPWFLTSHFCDDQVMPGTLMYESCMQSLRVFLLRMGWIADKNKSAYEPVLEVKSRLVCRGQVIPGIKKAIYEITIKELGYNPEPYAIADALMFADGNRIVQVLDMSIRLSGITQHEIEEFWLKRKKQSTANLAAELYTKQQIIEYAIGKPSACFGEKYKEYDTGKFLARLPGPPFLFVDRIIDVNAQPLIVQPGGTVTGQFDITPDKWFFYANKQSSIPFCILLEFTLQVCGWYSCYMGSAFKNTEPLHYRNLDGTATLYKDIKNVPATLTSVAKATKTADSAGMLIQSFDLLVTQGNEKVYEGTTTFGFFSNEALSNQVGLRGIAFYEPSPQELQSSKQINIDVLPPLSPSDPQTPTLDGLQLPSKALLMLDKIECFITKGGPHQLGYIRASKKVEPDEWFFKAHFYQDPVIPGSLGLESLIQLLKIFAIDRWGKALKGVSCSFEPIALNQKHTWSYRGQVLPTDKLVLTEALIKEIDDNEYKIVADGTLSVDNRIIYSMKDFAIKLVITS